jgi:hypothetical protein
MADHLRGQAMPQEVGSTAAGTAYSRSHKSSPDDVADRRRAAEPYARCPRSEKDSSRGTLTAAVVQVRGERLSDIGQQRKAISHSSFTSNQQFAATPTDIIQFHGDYFACSQAEACQEKQDGIIATATWTRAIRCQEHLCHLCG